LTVNYLVLTIIVNISIFFNDLLVKKRMNTRHEFQLSLIIQELYCALLAIILGFVMSVLGLFILLLFTQWEPALSSKFFLPFSGYIFVCLNCFIILNRNIKTLNLPLTILNFIALFLLLNINEKLKSIFLFILWTTSLLIICFVSTFIYINFHYVDNSISKILFLVALAISFLTAIFIYSEVIIDQEDRAGSQIVLWAILFIGLVILGCYQLSLYINGQLNDQMVINIGFLVIGLAFNMATIADKGRQFRLSVAAKAESLIENWINANRQYSFTYVMQTIKQHRKEVSLALKVTKQRWKRGEKLEVLTLYVLPLLIGFTSIVVMNIYNNSISSTVTSYFSNLIKRVASFWVSIFDGNEHLASTVFLLILAFCGLLWTVRELILKYQISSLEVKLLLIERLLFSLVCCATFAAILFNGLTSLWVIYLLLSLLVLLLALDLAIKFLRRRCR